MHEVYKHKGEKDIKAQILPNTPMVMGVQGAPMVKLLGGQVGYR